jgi:CheY-like chemotaxis protein
LAAGIAHDFNNLLTAINGFAALLQDELASDDPRQELAGKISHSGQRAADLVRQLLAFSRKQIIRPQKLDLNHNVMAMKKILERTIGENISLETLLRPDLWLVEVDPSQIEQVIVNLVVNARDAMLHGGCLTIETDNIILDEEMAGLMEVEAGDYLLLSISDTGVGMSEMVRTHIFEPFFTTKEVGKGTGLGLATVFGIVKQNRGHIEVYSQEGEGTTFKIYLPRALEDTGAGVEVGDEEKLPGGSETILLVEDDAEVRKLTERILQRQGYLLLAVEDGQEALELLDHYAGPIHLLLTDVIMPGISGRALAEQLRQQQPSLKILFMSGYADNILGAQGVLTPEVAFLQKPFSPSTLARKVRAALDNTSL